MEHKTSVPRLTESELRCVDAVSAWLTRLTNAGERVFLAGGDELGKRLTTYDGRYSEFCSNTSLFPTPELPLGFHLRYYVARLATRSAHESCDESVLVTACAYISFLLKREALQHQQQQQQEHALAICNWRTVHRLFLTCFVEAWKSTQEPPPTNRSLARAGLVSLQDLNKMEIAFLFRFLGFEYLFLDVRDYDTQRKALFEARGDQPVLPELSGFARNCSQMHYQVARPIPIFPRPVVLPPCVPWEQEQPPQQQQQQQGFVDQLQASSSLSENAGETQRTRLPLELSRRTTLDPCALKKAEPSQHTVADMSISAPTSPLDLRCYETPSPLLVDDEEEKNQHHHYSDGDGNGGGDDYEDEDEEMEAYYQCVGDEIIRPIPGHSPPFLTNNRCSGPRIVAPIPVFSALR